MNLFAYGTLQFPQVWRQVVGRSYPSQSGEVRGYCARRMRDAVYPGLVSATSQSVASGVVYQGVDRTALRQLDEFEGEPYRRIPVAVTCHDGNTYEAFAYEVRPSHLHLVSEEPWTRDEFIANGELERFIRSYPGFARLRPS